MSYPLKELSRLLAQDSGSVGVVVGFNGALVRLATEKGAVMARTLDVLAIGDRVLIRQGVAMKAPAATEVFPV
jgi:hypothetical protein